MGAISGGKILRFWGHTRQLSLITLFIRIVINRLPEFWTKFWCIYRLRKHAFNGDLIWRTKHSFPVDFGESDLLRLNLLCVCDQQLVIRGGDLLSNLKFIQQPTAGAYLKGKVEWVQNYSLIDKILSYYGNHHGHKFKTKSFGTYYLVYRKCRNESEI